MASFPPCTFIEERTLRSRGVSVCARWNTWEHEAAGMPNDYIRKCLPRQTRDNRTVSAFNPLSQKKNWRGLVPTNRCRRYRKLLSIISDECLKHAEEVRDYFFSNVLDT